MTGLKITLTLALTQGNLTEVVLLDAVFEDRNNWDREMFHGPTKKHRKKLRQFFQTRGIDVCRDRIVERRMHWSSCSRDSNPARKMSMDESRDRPKLQDHQIYPLLQE
mmetsp:Transcript_12685/g.25759  ORF Transcript_12685/g.25759 Transcript_12685/m.25759 type:complete len:108 (-) Transcript_12685:432-755(-)